MVGGIVIGLSRLDGKTHVHVAECPHHPKHSIPERPTTWNEESQEWVDDDRPPCHRPDTCCVYTDERKRSDGSAVVIAVGDSLWWQGGDCMWTPRSNRGTRCGVDYDIRIKKIGYSH